MQSAILTRYGKKLSIAQKPIPPIGPNQVLLKMLYSPIHPADLYFCKGIYEDTKTLPTSPGFEG
jgi:NADPH:quinone reductase-like Zn-dependent oxidoreductase